MGNNTGHIEVKQQSVAIVGVVGLAIIIFLMLIAWVAWLVLKPDTAAASDVVANAGGPYTIGEAQTLMFDGSGSVGENLSYTWDFGDEAVGTTATGSGVNPTYAYPDGPAAYDVSLTISDESGTVATDTTTVTVNNLPPTANAGGPYTCETNEIIQLTGECTDPSAVDAETLSCNWASFNGAALSEPLYHCPPTAGDVTLTLTAIDKDGASAQDSITVTVTAADPDPDPEDNQAPVAVIDIHLTSKNGMIFGFNGHQSYDPDGEIVAYEWDFGDGLTDDGVEVLHEYAVSGSYTVTLVVTDNEGAQGEATVQVTTADTPENQTPTAVIDTHLKSKSGMIFGFNGYQSYDPDGYIVTFNWDFGDGNTAEGAEVLHEYTTPNTYTVVLNVIDNHGATGNDAISVQAVEPPNQPPVALIDIHLHPQDGGPYGFNGYRSYDLDGTIEAYNWDFGDGNTAEGVEVMHEFTTSGPHNIVLTVTDNRDEVSSNTLTIP